MKVSETIRPAAEALANVPASRPPDEVAALLAGHGFRVHEVRIGHARTVYVGDGFVLKHDRGTMAGESARWRRTPAQEVAALQALGVEAPGSALVGDSVIVQERCDPDPDRYARRESIVKRRAAVLNVPNLHAQNVGWRNGQAVFLDLDYMGPDLTVALLAKFRTAKGRALQGEAPFWPHWGPTYLEKMVRNIRFLLPGDTRIVVMTDSPDKVPHGCDIALLEEDHPGWWSKLWQFRRDVTCGRVLYLDLDNVVAGNLTELLALTPDPMIIPDDRHMPGLANAGAMLYFAERVRYLWDEYAQDPAGWQRRYTETTWPHASDQAYVTGRLLEREGRWMPFFQDLLGEGYVLNSRVELEQGADWSKCQLLVGCWTPKPHESKHPFYARHWS